MAGNGSVVVIGGTRGIGRAVAEHYAAQDQPLFELIEGEGDKAVVKPLFAIPEILAAVKYVPLEELGRQATRRAV